MLRALSLRVGRARLRACLLGVLLMVVGRFAYGSEFLLGVGVHVMPGWMSLSELQTSINELGVNSFRDDFFWHVIERKKGELVFPSNREGFVSYVKQGKTIGQKPVVILDYGNAGYGGGDYPLDGEALDGFLKYTKYVVSELKGRGAVFQLWNEWNIGLGLPDAIRKPGTAEAYVRFLKKVAPVVREGDPGATLLSTSVARLDEEWIIQFARMGGLAYVDGFSVHPYVWSRKNFRPEDAVRWVDKMEGVLREANGGKDFPMYITEVGWPNHAGKPTFSESMSAAYNLRFLFLAKTRPWIQGVWIYGLKDDGVDPKNWDHHFGLVRNDGTKKIGYDVLKRTSRYYIIGAKAEQASIGNSVFVVRMEIGGGRSVSAVWSTDDSSQSVQVTGCSKPYDLVVGEATTFCAKGVDRLTVGAMPYVIEHRTGDLSFQ